ncbi:MAG: hypothetical protein R3F20_16755 [Planctomycetota bacterium]
MPRTSIDLALRSVALAAVLLATAGGLRAQEAPGGLGAVSEYLRMADHGIGLAADDLAARHHARWARATEPRKLGERSLFEVLEIPGPGVVTRIRGLESGARLVVVLDDETDAAIDVVLAELDLVAALRTPFSESGRGGAVISLPVTFGSRVRILSDRAGSNWSVDWTAHPAGTAVERFRLKNSFQSLYAAPAAMATLTGAIAPAEDGDPAAAKTVHPDADAALGLEAGARKVLLEREGAGCLTRIVMEELPDFLDETTLDALWLRVSCDGRETVRVTLSDLFAEPEAHEDRLGLRRRRETVASGIMRRRTFAWPQPFATSLRVELENQGSKPIRHLRFFLPVEPREGAPGHVLRATTHRARLAFHGARAELELARLEPGARLVSEVLRLDRAPGTDERFREGGEEMPVALRFGPVGAGLLSETRPGRTETLLVRDRALDVAATSGARRLALVLDWTGAPRRDVGWTIFRYVAVKR